MANQYCAGTRITAREALRLTLTLKIFTQKSLKAVVDYIGTKSVIDKGNSIYHIGMIKISRSINPPDPIAIKKCRIIQNNRILEHLENLNKF